MSERNWRLVMSACGIVLLAGCGDPLSDVDRLSSVEMAEGTSTVSVATAETAPAEGGFLSRLLSRPAPPVASQTDIAVQAALADAAEPTSDGVDLASDLAAPTAEQPAAERRGLFGFLRGGQQRDGTTASQTQTAQTAAPLTPETAVAGLPTDDIRASDELIETDKVAAVTGTAPEAQSRPRKGLFGLLSGARAKAEDAPEEAVRTAALAPAAPLRLGGNRNHKGPDVAIVPAGTRLAPGQIARVCDLPRGRLGKEVDRFPERGKGYKILDTAPSSAGPRPFYVTGFEDGCARTFTGALALFGSPEMHEQLRYGLPAKQTPYSTTDKAYENIKVSICKVSRRQPCGSKVGLLEKDTVFISIYDRLGSNAQWSNVLLHRGWVLAADRKG